MYKIRLRGANGAFSRNVLKRYEDVVQIHHSKQVRVCHPYIHGDYNTLDKCVAGQHRAFALRPLCAKGIDAAADSDGEEGDELKARKLPCYADTSEAVYSGYVVAVARVHAASKMSAKPERTKERTTKKRLGEKTLGNNVKPDLSTRRGTVYGDWAVPCCGP